MRYGKKKPFIKKIPVILFILLVAAAATWTILANKFEQYVKEQLPKNLEKFAWLVKVDLDSIKVNKYFFKISTNEAVFNPKNDFYQLTAAGIDCGYNPLSEKITLKFKGDKLSVKIGQTELYVEHPSNVISFNKSILEEDFSEFNITLSTGKTNLKSKAANMDIVGFDKSDIIITGKESDICGNYKIAISSEHKNLHLYAKSIKSAFNLSYQLSSGLYLNLLESTGSFDYESYYSFDLNKDFLRSLLLTLHNPNWDKILNGIDFFKDKYSIKVSDKLSNSYILIGGKLSLNNDGEKILANFSEKIDSNYIDSQKQELEAILTDLLYTSSTSSNNGLPLVKKGVLTKQDFDFIATKLINIKNADINLEAEYDIISENLFHSFALNINNHNFSLEGEGNIKEWLYNGTLKISEPRKLVDTLANIIEQGLYPIAKKSRTDSNTKEAEMLKDLANNIKEHGFAALTVFHKNSELKENEELISNILFNFKQFGFKLNNKGFIEIITDPRIKPFIENKIKTDSDKQENIMDSVNDPYSLIIP